MLFATYLDFLRYYNTSVWGGSLQLFVFIGSFLILLFFGEKRFRPMLLYFPLLAELFLISPVCMYILNRAYEVYPSLPLYFIRFYMMIPYFLVIAYAGFCLMRVPKKRFLRMLIACGWAVMILLTGTNIYSLSGGEPYHQIRQQDSKLLRAYNTKKISPEIIEAADYMIQSGVDSSVIAPVVFQRNFRVYDSRIYQPIAVRENSSAYVLRAYYEDSTSPESASDLVKTAHKFGVSFIVFPVRDDDSRTYLTQLGCQLVYTTKSGLYDVYLVDGNDAENRK